MVLRAAIVLGLCLSLAACGSRLNPFTWFGGASEEQIATEDTVAETPSDPRPLVAELVGLRVDALPSGAVVTATGRTTRQGFWQAELVEVSRENGRLVYEFRLQAPAGDTPEGPAAARELIVATDLSNQELADIREIVVESATNRLTSRR